MQLSAIVIALITNIIALINKINEWFERKSFKKLINIINL